MNNLTTVIFSAWRSTNDLIANMEASEKARQELIELNIMNLEGVGSYQEHQAERPTQEVSHVALCADLKEVNKVRRLARELNQDSVLLIDSLGRATLDFLNGSMVQLGRFERVTKETAKAEEHYTYIAGTYYICKA